MQIEAEIISVGVITPGYCGESEIVDIIPGEEKLVEFKRRECSGCSYSVKIEDKVPKISDVKFHGSCLIQKPNKSSIK